MKEYKNIEESEKIVKRFPLNRETYKYLKKMAIDLDLDTDGAIKPEVIGECIDKAIEIIKKKQQ
jgi:hypothetical protein